MTVKKFVTPDNLSEEHFIFNQEKKKIDVIFPEGSQLPTGLVTDLHIDDGANTIHFKTDGVPQKASLGTAPTSTVEVQDAFGEPLGAMIVPSDAAEASV